MLGRHHHLSIAGFATFAALSVVALPLVTADPAVALATPVVKATAPVEQAVTAVPATTSAVTADATPSVATPPPVSTSAPVSTPASAASAGPSTSRPAPPAAPSPEQAASPLQIPTTSPKSPTGAATNIVNEATSRATRDTATPTNPVTAPASKIVNDATGPTTPATNKLTTTASKIVNDVTGTTVTGTGATHTINAIADKAADTAPLATAPTHPLHVGAGTPAGGPTSSGFSSDSTSGKHAVGISGLNEGSPPRASALVGSAGSAPKREVARVVPGAGVALSCCVQGSAAAKTVPSLIFARLDRLGDGPVGGVGSGYALGMSSDYGLSGASAASSGAVAHGSAPVAPAPAPLAPAGGLGISAAGGAASGLAFFLILSFLGLSMLGAPGAMRRLKLASERWRPALFVLIPERPG